MENLIEILAKETAPLKKQFLRKTSEWAMSYFRRLTDRKQWNEEKWCKFFSIEPEVCNPGTGCQFLGFPRGFYNTEEGREYIRIRNDIRSILPKGIFQYEKKQMDKARQHYQASLEKLAGRIEKKSLNYDLLKVQTAFIGVNIEMTLTDGKETVKAWTIVAEGDVQKPHYRYLIK